MDQREQVMPRAVPPPVRQALWAAATGPRASTTELAERFGLPARTVRRLLQSARAAGKPTAPAYHTGPRPGAASAVCAAALLLKEEHPAWGARFILGVLAESHHEDDLPHERTVRRWFRSRDKVPAPAGRRPERLPRAKKPHQRWQVDAADQMHLADGSDLSWLKGMDECSGAALGTALFPPRAVQPGAGPPGAARLA
jgi:hypothetical protein